MHFKPCFFSTAHIPGLGTLGTYYYNTISSSMPLCPDVREPAQEVTGNLLRAIPLPGQRAATYDTK